MTRQYLTCIPSRIINCGDGWVDGTFFSFNVSIDRSIDRRLTNQVLTEITDCMTAEGRAVDMGDTTAAELWAKHNRLVAVLSYRWLTRLHADPHGLHLEKVRTFLKGARAFEAVFIDFSCVPQKDANGARTATDQAMFERALAEMGAFYSSAKGGTVLQLK